MSEVSVGRLKSHSSYEMQNLNLLAKGVHLGGSCLQCALRAAGVDKSLFKTKELK